MKHFILFICLLFCLSPVIAQPPGHDHDMSKEKREMIQKRKIAFITSELDFSSDEAEKFWPVYNELEEKMEALHKEKRGLLRQLKAMDELSDNDAYERMEDLLALEKKETTLRSDYLKKFASILGKKKAAKVYIAEEKFKRELVRIMHKRGQHGGHDRQGP